MCLYVREIIELSSTEYCSTGNDRYSCAAVLMFGVHKEDGDVGMMIMRMIMRGLGYW